MGDLPQTEVAPVVLDYLRPTVESEQVGLTSDGSSVAVD